MQITTGDLVYAQSATRIGDEHSGKKAGMSFELGHDQSVVVTVGDLFSYSRRVMITYQEFIEMAAAIVAIKEKREDAQTTADLGNTGRTDTDHASCTRCGNSTIECIC